MSKYTHLTPDLFRAAVLGGGSFKPDGSAVNYRNGYAVSIHQYGTSLADFSNLRVSTVLATIDKFLERNESAIDSGLYFIGVWLDRERDHLWLDLSVQVNDINNASIRAASERQRAIWSFEDNMSLDLDYRNKDVLHRYVVDVLLPMFDDIGYLDIMLRRTINTMYTLGLDGPVGARKAFHMMIAGAIEKTHGNDDV